MGILVNVRNMLKIAEEKWQKYKGFVQNEPKKLQLLSVSFSPCWASYCIFIVCLKL